MPKRRVHYQIKRLIKMLFIQRGMLSCSKRTKGTKDNRSFASVAVKGAYGLQDRIKLKQAEFELY